MGPEDVCLIKQRCTELLQKINSVVEAYHHVLLADLEVVVHGGIFEIS